VGDALFIFLEAGVCGGGEADEEGEGGEEEGVRFHFGWLGCWVGVMVVRKGGKTAMTAS
jgi:hypothetical protein